MHKFRGAVLAKKGNCGPRNVWATGVVAPVALAPLCQKATIVYNKNRIRVMYEMGTKLPR
jgi:hypothetical protein